MEQKAKHIIWWEGLTDLDRIDKKRGHYGISAAGTICPEEIQRIYEKEHGKQKPKHIVWWEGRGPATKIILSQRYFPQQYVSGLSEKDILVIYEKEHPSTERYETDFDLYPGNEAGAFDHLDNEQNEMDGDKEGEELGITPGEWKVAMNGNSVWSNNVTTICQLEQLPEQMANATLIASAPSLRADNERLRDEVEIYKEFFKQAGDKNKVVSGQNAALLEEVKKMRDALISVRDYEKRCAAKGDPKIGTGILSIMFKAIQEAETLLDNK